MVVHYVTEHRYQPPPQFIDAVKKTGVLSIPSVFFSAPQPEVAPSYFDGAIRVTTTGLGRKRLTFVDMNRKACQMQVDPEDENWLLFGIKDGGEDARMLLSRERLHGLLPYLIRFAETGQLE